MGPGILKLPYSEAANPTGSCPARKPLPTLFMPSVLTALPPPHNRQSVLTSSNRSPEKPAPRASSSSPNCSRVTDFAAAQALFQPAQQRRGAWTPETRRAAWAAEQPPPSRSRAGSSSAAAGGSAGAAGPWPGSCPSPRPNPGAGPSSSPSPRLPPRLHRCDSERSP